LHVLRPTFPDVKFLKSYRLTLARQRLRIADRCVLRFGDTPFATLPSLSTKGANMARKTQTIEQLDASIARWKTRLRRAVNTLGTLEKKRKRLAAKQPPAFLKHAEAADIVDAYIERQSVPPSLLGAGGRNGDHGSAEPHATAAQPIVAPPADTDIPDFLRRTQPRRTPEQKAAAKAAMAASVDATRHLSDAIAAAQIKEEQAAKAKAKAAGRIAKMKAKKAGDLKKMPLSGKAALDHIDNG
jgi:hypothetical protein